jgi:probable F420-dependent oxidoreductase
MAVRSILVGEPLGLADQSRIAVRAEALGYDRAWFAETSGPDAFVAAAATAAATSRIELGTAVVPVYTRTPALMAMAAASVADLSGRTFRLGIGAGGKAIIERWHGIPMETPLARLRSAIEIARSALAGERTDHSGALSSHGFVLRRDGASSVPIYLAALGPKALRLAGEVADGVVLAWLPIDRVAAAVATVRQAAEAAGRDPASVDVCCRILLAVTDDVDAMRALMPATLTPYLSAPAYNRFFASSGFDAEADAFAAAFAAKDRAGTRAAISGSMVDKLLVAGNADWCRGQLQQVAAAGVDDVIVSPYLDAPADIVEATIEALPT